MHSRDLPGKPPRRLLGKRLELEAWRHVQATRAHGRGLPWGKTWTQGVSVEIGCSLHRAYALAPEPVACVRHRGPTPFHPEPGRETRLRRRYWRLDRWESRSVRH